MAQPVFLLFSGYNDRAVVALCRFFARQQLPFVIVAAGPTDIIWRTSWASSVILSRLDKSLDLSLFQAAVRASQESRLVYCPTTEFMNQFVLDRRPALEAVGLEVALPPAAIYAQITSKKHSITVFRQLTGIGPPPNWTGPS